MKTFVRTVSPLVVLVAVVGLAHGAISQQSDASVRLLVGLMALTTAIGAATLMRLFLADWTGS
jgi:hypothetical protein